MSVLVYEWRCLSEDRQQEVLALRAVYEEIWTDCLEALRAQGLLEDDAFVVRRLITGMASWANTWFDQHGSLSLEALAHIIVRRVIGEPRDR